MLKTVLLAVISLHLISSQLIIPSVDPLLNALGVNKLSTDGLSCNPLAPNTAFDIDYTNNGTYAPKGVKVAHPYCRCQTDAHCNQLLGEWCPPNDSLKCIRDKPCDQCALDEYCIGTFRSRTILKCSKKKGKGRYCERSIECLSGICYNNFCTRSDLVYAAYNIFTNGVAKFQCDSNFDCFTNVCKVRPPDSDGFNDSQGKTVCTVNNYKATDEPCFEPGECEHNACTFNEQFIKTCGGSDLGYY